MDKRIASMFVFVLVFIVTSVSGKVATRISGGTETQAQNVPYQVAIVKTGNTILLCGGVLIRPNFVLTSAYCASPLKAADVQVIVGTNILSLNSEAQIVDVENIKMHQAYDPATRRNDLALIKLKRELVINQPTVDIISIRQTDLPATAICTISGWGSNVSNGTQSEILKSLELFVVDYVICSWIFEERIQVGQFCAGGKEGQNACVLDEGNPLVCSGELVGIVSNSTNCGKDKKPSVYTEVYKYSDWIESMIESMSSAAVTTLSSFITIAMPVGILSYWKGTT